jgi:hypothetical protein
VRIRCFCLCILLCKSSVRIDSAVAIMLIYSHCIRGHADTNELCTKEYISTKHSHA